MLLEIAGLTKDLPCKIECSEFPAAAPFREALNVGALDVGCTGDLLFPTVHAAGAPITAIGGTRSDARTQAILVRSAGGTAYSAATAFAAGGATFTASLP